MVVHGTRKKAIIGLLFLFLFILSAMLPKVPAQADTLVTDDGFQYEITENNEVTILKYKGKESNLVIPASIEGLPVTRIEEDAFYGKDSITSIEFPNTLREIGEYAFAFCTSLTSLTLPEGLTTLEKGAFAVCNKLETVKLPSTLQTMGLYVFSTCIKLKEITIPEGVTELKPGTFEACFSLQTVHLPNSLVRIGVRNFEKCSSLKEIRIPAGVTFLELNSFNGCTSLMNIYVDGGNTVFNSSGGCLYNKDGTEFLFCPVGKTDVTVKKGVTTIGNTAFLDCALLKSVDLPAGLKTISYHAFDGCSSLTSLTIPNSVTLINNNAFLNCSSLCYVNIPAGVTTIKEGAFDTGSDLVLFCYEGSEGESYAKNNGIRVLPYSFLGNPFQDVAAGKYYTAPVLWAFHSEPQITTGTSNTTFEPSATCTRAQVVTFLWRMMGSPDPKTKNNPFQDVAVGKYYYKPVLWAYENGITTGKSADCFDPSGICTRGQFVTFLWRVKGKPSAKSSTNPFTDVESGKYYLDAVIWAAENGITTGIDEEHFAPSRNVSRGQAVTFLFRIGVEK